MAHHSRTTIGGKLVNQWWYVSGNAICRPLSEQPPEAMSSNEQRNDKTNDCAPSEDSDKPGHPPSLISLFAVHMKKAWVLSYPLSTPRRLWSDWVDAQADLSLHWTHTHFVAPCRTRGWENRPDAPAPCAVSRNLANRGAARLPWAATRVPGREDPGDWACRLWSTCNTLLRP